MKWAEPVKRKKKAEGGGEGGKKKRRKKKEKMAELGVPDSSCFSFCLSCSVS